MRDEAEKRIGHLYPKVMRPKEHGGGEATVIAWLWARTVTCPNPACGARMPLVRSFALSNKPGKQAWVEPVVDRSVHPPKVRFEVHSGKGKPRDGTVNRRGAICICCSTPVPFDHVRDQGKAGLLGVQLMAIVAEGKGERMFLPPAANHEAAALEAKPLRTPGTELPKEALGFRVQNYGIERYEQLFTRRQLSAIITFSDLVSELAACRRNASLRQTRL